MKRIVFLTTAGLAVVIILLGASIYKSATTTSGHSYEPVVCWWESSTCDQIKSLERELARNDLSQEMRQKYTALHQALSYDARLEATSVSKLTQMPSEVAAALSKPRTPKLTWTASPRITGIMDGRPVPFSSKSFRFTNSWLEYVNDRYIFIFAGSLAEDPTQGVLVVFDEINKSKTVYLTPDKSGSVRIETVDRLHLKLASQSQTIYYFDVGHPAFVNSFEEDGKLTMPPLEATFNP